jgi:ABC-type Zn uptake system ZnuABC Zn-binding protein ZnuA
MPGCRARRILLTLATAAALPAAGCAAPTADGAANDSTTASRPNAGPTTPSTAFTCPPTAADAGVRRAGPSEGDRLRVVTTVAPITSIVANVAGDRADVVGVIPEGEDSHTFEPKPSAARSLADADVVFVNGLKLEDPTKELAATNLRAEAQVVELGTVALAPNQYVYDFSFPVEGGKPNPHVWTNPPMARCYVSIVASVLTKADPANAATYRDNAARYEAKVDALDQLMVTATATVPAANRKLLTYHDAYAYFAQHYGWTVIGAIQVSSFEDPTPKEVVALIEQVRSEKVPAIFGSEVFPSPVLEQISSETGATYVDHLRDDDLPGAPGDAEHSYLGLMREDFVTMVKNLGGDVTALQAFDVADVVTDRAEYPQ